MFIGTLKTKFSKKLNILLHSDLYMKESRSVALFLIEMLSCILSIEFHVKGLTKEQFFTEKAKREATERNLEILGEAARHIPEALKAKHGNIEWSKMIAVRNILIHDYFEVDEETVWEIAVDKLPNTYKNLKDLICEFMHLDKDAFDELEQEVKARINKGF